MIDIDDTYGGEDSYKDCEDCEGDGKFPICEMCGGDIDTDTLLCYGCREHSDYTECETCEGTGLVLMEIDEYKDHLLWKQEAENDLRHDELMEEHYKRKRDGK